MTNTGELSDKKKKKKEIKRKAKGDGGECMTALMKATRTAFSPSGIIFYFLYLLRSCAEREREEKGNEKYIYIKSLVMPWRSKEGRVMEGGLQKTK